MRAALANSGRGIKRAVLTERAAEELGPRLLARTRWEKAEPDAVGRLLHPGSVHQGAALLCEALPDGDLKHLLENTAGGRASRAGARPDHRSAQCRRDPALGARPSASPAVDRAEPGRAASESGVLAKAARPGALDIVPYVSVVNIARTLEELGTAGFWRVALAGDGEQSLEDVRTDGDMALVLGSEGEAG